MKKKCENKQNVLHTIKVNYDMAIQVNNELKVKVDDQQVDTKHLKNNLILMMKTKFRKPQLIEPHEKELVCV